MDYATAKARIKELEGEIETIKDDIAKARIKELDEEIAVINQDLALNPTTVIPGSCTFDGRHLRLNTLTQERMRHEARLMRRYRIDSSEEDRRIVRELPRLTEETNRRLMGVTTRALQDKKPDPTI